MYQIDETFATYRARIEKVMDQTDKPIVLSTEIPVPKLKTGIDQRIEMTPIAWPLYNLEQSMFYLVDVPARTHVSRHAHDEDIFRFVMKGSLVVNGNKIDEGTWFVIKANTPYEISTEGGYRIIAIYTKACKPADPNDKHWVEED